MLSARGFNNEVHGKGEPVLFIHGALIADTFLPLIALAAPKVVRSLILLEPALVMVPSAPACFEATTPAIDKFKAGEPVGAAGAFVTLVGGLIGGQKLRT